MSHNAKCKIIDVSQNLLIFAATIVFSQLAQAKDFSIGVGELKNFPISGLIESIHLSKPGIVEVSRGANRSTLKVRALKTGDVDITANLADQKAESIKIYVKNSASPSLESVRKILDNGGLSVQENAGKILVSGKAGSLASAKNIANIKKKFPGSIVDLTEKTSAKPQSVVQAINRLFTENQIYGLQAVSYGKIITVEGTPRDDFERELAMRIAKSIQNSVEDRTAGKSKASESINIEVMFVDVERRDHLKVGVSRQQLAGSLAQATIAGPVASLGKLSWQVSDLDMFLNLLQYKTSSRLLSNPQIIGRSGEEAKFHSGGKALFGVDTTDASGKTKTDIKEIDYGVELNVKPVIDRVGLIDIKLHTKVSELTPSNMKNQLAEILLTDLKTSVSLRSGQSILLSGLVHKRQRKGVEKVPILGDIPIIGELFKSRSRDLEERELMIFVTLQKITPGDYDSAQVQKLWDNSKKDVEFSIFD